MFESKYNKLLTVILIIVVVAIIGLIGFLVFQFIQNSNNTQEAENFVDNYVGDEDIPEDEEPAEKIDIPDENTTSGNTTIGDLEVAPTSSSGTVRTKRKLTMGS